MRLDSLIEQTVIDRIDALNDKPVIIKHCIIQACHNPQVSRGMCMMHYQRTRRNGGPLVKKRRRGVMDAPVPKKEKGVYLGPAQRVFMVALAKGTTDAEELADALGYHFPTRRNAVHQMVCALRKRFGYEVILTKRGGGYELGRKVRL